MMCRLRTTVSTAAAVLLVTLLALEAVLVAGDADRHPPPGHLVPVGDASFHLDCSGTGAPTVVLEAGLGEPGLGWAEVQEGIAQRTRVCSYDRQGLGWSTAAARDWSAATSAAQLVRLLDTAGEDGPYVLVAHSIGSFVAREMHRQHPKQVAGMVLVDPTDEVAAATTTAAPALAQRAAFGWLIRLGAPRWLGRRLVAAVVGSTPPTPIDTAAPVVYDLDANAAARRELWGVAASASALTGPPGRAWSRLDLTIISAATTPATTLRRRDALAAASATGQHQTAPGTGHYVHYDQPGIVVAAVLDIVGRRA